MNTVVRHMQADLGVEEGVCSGEASEVECIPVASKIPHIGDGAYMKLVKQARELGNNFFDPDEIAFNVEKACANKASYDAIQFQKFWDGLQGLTDKPHLSVDQPNGYTECEDAVNGTGRWKAHAEADYLEDTEMKRTAKHIVK